MDVPSDPPVSSVPSTTQSKMILSPKGLFPWVAMLYPTVSVTHLAIYCLAEVTFLPSQQGQRNKTLPKWDMFRRPAVPAVFCFVIFAIIFVSGISFTVGYKSIRTIGNKCNSHAAVTRLQHHNLEMISEKRILQSLVTLGVALAGFSRHASALELPVSYTSDDKSITFKHTDDLLFSPKPLKTHDKEILFKSETIKGFNAGVTVSASHVNPIFNLS